MAASQGNGLHVGIAERGKVLALEGDHGEALRHYREAIRMAVESGAPEVFFRHYTQCVLESLERMESWKEILDFCERAEEHYQENPPPNDLARFDRASHAERRGVVLLQANRLEEARAALERAVENANPKRLHLAETVLGWLRSGWHVDRRRLRAEQDRHRYFVVRRDAVDPTRAVSLPKGVGQPFN